MRVQAGWLDTHPIRVYCGNCGILFSGICKMDQRRAKIDISFKNANECNEEEKYYIESSGELITSKLKPCKEKELFITPFIKTMHYINEDMGIFKNNVMEFLNKSKEEWYLSYRVLELYINNQNKYLEREIHKLLPEDKFPCDSGIERLRAAHFLVFRQFNILYGKGFVEKTMNEFGLKIMKLSKEKISPLIEYYKNNNDMLSLYSKKIFAILDEFVSVFQFLIPAYGLTFYKKDDIDFNLYGTTTCSFEDIKQFYLDAYEVIGDIILLPIGLNNIVYRGNFETINDSISKSPKVKKFYDLFKITKGQRSKYIDLNELFCKVTELQLNGKLRNAIGHNDYSYDGITQKITYIPNSSQPNKKKEIYLLEFSLECIKLMKGILMIDEIMYRVKEYQCILEGDIPKSIMMILSKGL